MIPPHDPAGFPRRSAGGTRPSEAGPLGKAGAILIFLLAALDFIQFNLVGLLFLSDLLALVLTPLLLLMAKGTVSREMKWFGIMLSLWIFGAVSTDLIRDTPFEDYARGWARLGFFSLYIVSAYLLSGDREDRIVLFGCGYAIGEVLQLVLGLNAAATFNPFKFGLGIAIVVLIAAVAPNLWPKAWQKTAISASVLFLIGAYGLLLETRYLFLILTITAGAIWLSTSIAARGRSKVSMITLVTIVVGGGLILVGVKSTYEYGAGSGLLGAAVQKKYLEQSANDLGLLLGGRNESLVSLQAIADSPIIGHGSWAKDPKYVLELIEILKSHGESEAVDPNDAPLIPTHSALFGSWVEAGVLGALFWIFTLFLVFRSIIQLFTIESKYRPLYFFQLFSMVWDILFSPLGYTSRIAVPFNMLIICWIAARHRYLHEPAIKSPRSLMRHPA